MISGGCDEADPAQTLRPDRLAGDQAPAHVAVRAGAKPVRFYSRLGSDAYVCRRMSPFEQALSRMPVRIWLRRS